MCGNLRENTQETGEDAQEDQKKTSATTKGQVNLGRSRKINGFPPCDFPKKVAQRERLGVKSSVDVDDFARDVGGIIRGEEGSEGCNFVGCAEAAERN